MQLHNPLPWACVLLAPLLGGVWLAGRAIARRVSDDGALADVLAPGLGGAAWLAAMHLAARLTGSFVAGLAIATVVLGLAGFAARWQEGPLRPARAGGRNRDKWWMLAGALTATLAIAPAALGWAFHDELWLTGHMSIAAQIQNGAYPPRHLSFPAFELRYHYGFSLLCAAVTALLRVPLEHSLDLVTLLCWPYCWCLLWTLGERLIGRPGGPLAALALFGGGIPFFCNLEAPPARSLLGLCRVDGALLNPPLVSYFFQHPWTIGLPLGLCLLLVLQERRRPPGLWRYVACAVLLAALALSQIVLFAALSAVLLVAEPLGSRDCRLRRCGGVLAAVASSWLLARAMGGFFAPAPDGAELGLVASLGVADSLRGTALYHLQTFGATLLLGAVGLALLRRERLTIGLLVLGGLGVPNLVRYAHSWDVAKFGALASLGLGVGFAATAARLLGLRWRLLGGVLAALVLASCTAAGLAFAAVFALRLEGIPEQVYHHAPVALAPPDVAVVSWLRSRVRPGEIVFREPAVGLGYAQHGGLAQPWIDHNAARFDFGAERIARRERLLATLPRDPSAWRNEGVRWFVVGRRDQAVERLLAAWLQAGDAEIRAAIGPLWIAYLR
ncbi:MAG: hypothetical protein HY744_01070 [Deltaproteobacteria bacterium]|nr:hypothetical protein [Deltaproteobacteria bacterium]